MSTPRPRHAAWTAPAVTAVILTALTCTTQPAPATPYAANGFQAGVSARIRAGGNHPDLALAGGATLAGPKVLDLDAPVLDIGQITEEPGGAERREDTNTQETLTLQAEVLFSKDSARLGDTAMDRITAIAHEIKKQRALKVRICGFTDNLGSAAHGTVLSQQRAAVVHDALESAPPAKAITIEAHGYGEAHPIASNATEAGRTKNRRVEISFPRTPG